MTSLEHRIRRALHQSDRDRFNGAPGSVSLPRGSRQSGTQTLPVSVVIPAYNRAGVIPRAIASIAGQRGSHPAEVIVVDDGSEDGTSETAEKLGARVVRHGKNRGVSAARSSGVTAAMQPWVAFLDSDDEWLPNHLSTVWAFRKGHILVADTALRCGNDPLRYKRHGPLTRGPQRLSDPAHLIFPGDRIPTSGTLIRRESIEQVGGFRPLDRAEDLDLWLRLLERGTALLLPWVGHIHHLHPAQLNADGVAVHDAHENVARRYADRPWYSEDLIERWRGLVLWDHTRHALRHRRFADAAESILRLMRNPQRIFGAMRFATGRTRNLRASARIASNGEPSIAVLIRDPESRQRALEEIGDRPRIDLNEVRRISAYARLLHRPTSFAVVDSMAAAFLLKLARIRTIYAGGHQH